MKKLLLALVAMWVCFSASAVDYYLIGGFNSWTLKQANCMFTPQSDGTYVLEYNGTLTSGFKINDGTWGATYNYGAQNGAKLTVGQPYTVWANSSSGNIETSDGGSISNPKLIFNPSQNSLLITGQALEAVTIYGIHGDIFGVSTWSTENMTESNGKWVLANKTINAGAFGIKGMDKATENQTSWYSTNNANDAAIVVDKTVNCVLNGNTNFSIAAGTYTFTFDPSNSTLLVTGTSTGETPSVNEYGNWWVNVMGSFAGGDNTDTAPNTQPDADGIASFTNLALGTAVIEIKTWDGSNDGYYSNGSTAIPLDQWVQLGDAQATRSPIAGATDDSVYDIQFNVTNNQVYITRVSGGSDTPETPVTLYIVGGNVNGESVWENMTKYPLTYNEADQTYTWTGETLGSGFKINNGSWDNGYNIGQGQEGNLKLGEKYTVYNGNSADIYFDGFDVVNNPSLTLDLNNNTLVLNGTIPEEVTYPDNLYVIGTLKDGTWNPQVGSKMTTGENGVYTVEGVELVDPDGNGAMFSFCTQLSNDANDWNDLGTRYGADVNSGKDVDITSGSTYPLVQDGDPKPYAGAAGTYSITVDLAKMEMTATWVEASEPEMAVNDFKAVSENVEETTADIVVSYTVENAPENAKYTVYYQEANGEEQSVEATATGATINLTDLTAATEYTYTLSLAVNDEKVADVEASVNFTTKNASSEEPTPEVGETIEATFNFDNSEDVKTYDPTMNVPESPWSNQGIPFTNMSNDNVTLSVTPASSGNVDQVYFFSSTSSDLRLYPNNIMTISVPEGYRLDEVIFTGSQTSAYINKLYVTDRDNLGDFVYDGTVSSAKTMTWTSPEGVDVNAISVTQDSGTTRYTKLTVKATKLPEEPGLPEFGENTYTIYGNGVLNGDLQVQDWWKSSNDFQATNPVEDSVEKVFSFKSSDGGTDASMGLATNGTPNTGIFHDATLNFDWYANTAATYTVRLTCPGLTPDFEFNYNVNVTEDDLNKWNTTSFSVASLSEALAEGWNNDENLGEGVIFSIIVSNGSAESVMYLNNIYYSNVDYDWVAPEHEFVAPETVPVPTQAEKDVLSVYSSAYTPATTFRIGGWGQTTTVTDQVIDGSDVEWLRNYNYLGWELNSNINVEDYEYMHVDFWTATEDASFGVTPISPGPKENLWPADVVTASEWNSYDIPLSYFSEGGVDLSNIFQIKFDNGNNNEAYLANVYFWKEPAPETSFVVMGNINDDSSWKNSFEFVNYNDGIYSTEKFDKLVEFKLNDNGTWYGYDGSGYAPLNETFKVAAGDNYGNVSFGLSGYVADAVISFNPETLEVSVSGTWVSTALELYFMGAKNDWTANPDYKMSTQDGKVYTLTLSDLDAGSEFKFAAANWSPEYTNGNKSLENGTYDITSGGNMALGKSMTNVTFTLDIDKKTLTIAGTESGFVTLYLRGSMNDWNATDEWKFNTTDGENYVLENVNIPAGATMKIANSGWEGSYTYTYTEAPIALNTEYTLVNLTGDNDNMYMSVAAENATVNYNINTHKFEIVAEEVVVIPETLYLIGNINNLGFLANNTKKMEPVKDEAGNVVARSFGAENVVFDNVDNTGDSYFAFCTQTGSTPDAWNELGTRYGAESRDLRIEEGNTKPLAITADNYSFMIEAGTYDILVTFDEDGNGSVKVLKAGTLGVDGIEAEGGEAEYYTLSGIKVANPIEGQIYIKVQNGKAVKIIK